MTNSLRILRSISRAGLALLLCSWTAFSVANGAERAPKAKKATGPKEASKSTEFQIDTARGDKMIAEYFRKETSRLEQECLADIKTLDDWNAKKGEYRRQLFEMLGLEPLPPKSPLKPVITGKVDHPEFTVENLHFQSMPGLYVTGNLYVPKKLKEKAPTILYVCGHARVIKDGVSYGNKTHYHFHAGWFARNGYVCLVIDTLQLGEIQGIHHGTYSQKMHWWNSRGYTSAGVEAWNCIRALDYLETRPEVDSTRFGVTGRSGGGAYSWWISALDERIKVSVPVAGITSLRNHVVDGVIEGHCDCMFHLNFYRWDFPMVAALVAPRPLLISNTDKDTIFPLDGVVDVYFRTKKIYDLYGKPRQLGLCIAEGPHHDVQELQIQAFQWFNKFLKGIEPQQQISTTAPKIFQPEQLKVFDKLPKDEKNTSIQESFTTIAPPPKVPGNQAEWDSMRRAWLKQLQEKTFHGWPTKGQKEPLALKRIFHGVYDEVELTSHDFTSQGPVRLRLYVVQSVNKKDAGKKREIVVLNVLSDDGWKKFVASMRQAFPGSFVDETLLSPDLEGFKSAKQLLSAFRDVKLTMVYVAPRGIGPTAWNQTEKKQTQIRRRFALLGQTLDGMRVYDVVRAIEAVRSLIPSSGGKFWLNGDKENSVVCLYGALMSQGIDRVDLWHLPKSHRHGPDLVNVLRVLDVPAAVAMAADKMKVRLYELGDEQWDYPRQVAKVAKSESGGISVMKVDAQGRQTNGRSGAPSGKSGSGKKRSDK